MDLPGGPTKDEILAISLFKLGLQKDDVFADIGCGTGRFRSLPLPGSGRYTQSNRRDEAVECARTEVGRSGLSNIDIIHGEAVDFLRSAGRIDVAFVGGSRQLEEVLTLLKSLGARTIVVNAVMLETVTTAVKTMQELGIFKEAVHAGIRDQIPSGRESCSSPRPGVYHCGGCKPVLIGLGLGPGEPELLTIRAVRLLQEADGSLCRGGSHITSSAPIAMQRSLTFP